MGGGCGAAPADTPRQARDELRERGLAVSDLDVFAGKAATVCARLAVVGGSSSEKGDGRLAGL